MWKTTGPAALSISGRYRCKATGCIWPADLPTYQAEAVHSSMLSPPPAYPSSTARRETGGGQRLTVPSCLPMHPMMAPGCMRPVTLRRRRVLQRTKQRLCRHLPMHRWPLRHGIRCGAAPTRIINNQLAKWETGYGLVAPSTVSSATQRPTSTGFPGTSDSAMGTSRQ